MGQRINMQFTIDIDELPSETKRILTKTEQQIEALSTELEEISKSQIFLREYQCSESHLCKVKYLLLDFGHLFL